jgi:agmatine deiminase
VQAIARFEPVELLVQQESRDSAVDLLYDLKQIHFHEIPTNDSWIRDHGPIFLDGPSSLAPALLDFQYNAWGNKYPPFDLDNLVPARVAELTQRQSIRVPVVLEGGSVEGNGQGLVLTTTSCLQNPNRNPDWSCERMEQVLRDYLSAEHIIWLDGEIPGDDTDGHIDQIARFVNPSTVVVLDLPGSRMWEDNRGRLNTWSREHQIPLEIVRLPGPVPRQAEGFWLPASYANFYLVNGAILVPVFNDPADDAACDVLASCFPDRQLVPVLANDLVFGLGALHCLSQQEPLWTGSNA